MDQPDTNAEDLPGYDGPTIDPYDRLQMWMDKSIPPADRDRLIAEYRDQVLTEAADWFEAGCPYLGKNTSFTVCTCSAATYLREYARSLASHTTPES